MCRICTIAYDASSGYLQQIMFKKDLRMPEKGFKQPFPGWHPKAFTFVQTKLLE